MIILLYFWDIVVFISENAHILLTEFSKVTSLSSLRV